MRPALQARAHLSPCHREAGRPQRVGPENQLAEPRPAAHRKLNALQFPSVTAPTATWTGRRRTRRPMRVDGRAGTIKTGTGTLLVRAGLTPKQSKGFQHNSTSIPRNRITFPLSKILLPTTQNHRCPVQNIDLIDCRSSAANSRRLPIHASRSLAVVSATVNVAGPHGSAARASTQILNKVPQVTIWFWIVKVWHDRG